MSLHYILQSHWVYCVKFSLFYFKLLTGSSFWKLIKYNCHCIIFLKTQTPESIYLHNKCHIVKALNIGHVNTGHFLIGDTLFYGYRKIHYFNNGYLSGRTKTSFTVCIFIFDMSFFTLMFQKI